VVVYFNFTTTLRTPRVWTLLASAQRHCASKRAFAGLLHPQGAPSPLWRAAAASRQAHPSASSRALAAHQRRSNLESAALRGPQRTASATCQAKLRAPSAVFSTQTERRRLTPPHRADRLTPARVHAPWPRTSVGATSSSQRSEGLSAPRAPLRVEAARSFAGLLHPNGAPSPLWRAAASSRQAPARVHAPWPRTGVGATSSSQRTRHCASKRSLAGLHQHGAPSPTVARSHRRPSRCARRRRASRGVGR
jgi:hypothetical protein